MSTMTDLNAAIRTQIDAVSGVENVYGYARFVADWSPYLGLFKSTTGDIRGWMVTLANPAITTVPDTFGTREWTYHFLISGALQIKDSINTEETFLTQAESILTALCDETTFGVAGVQVRGFDPQLRRVWHDQLGSVHCHLCEITLDVPVQMSFD